MISTTVERMESLMQRRLPQVLSVLLVVMVFWPVCPCQAVGIATAAPDHLTLTWTGNPATTMTVTWRTDAAVASGFVEYQKGSVLSGEAHRAKAAFTNFTTDLQATRVFSGNLTGLSANTTYSYRVGDGKHWSGTHTFSTANPESQAFKFLVFGDSQSPAGGSSPYSVWRDTLHNAYRANPDAKFIVNVGDLVDTGQSGAHWNGWFAAAAGVIDTIPEMPVVGNHEMFGSSDTDTPAYWNAQFRLPQNGPSRLKNRVYSYDYGPVHIVVLDSQQSGGGQYGGTFASQIKWLDADLASSKAPWKIVFFHKAVYFLKDGRSNTAFRKAFCPVLEKHHVDVVFNAHDHGIGRTYPIKNGVSKSRPTEGTVYYVVGRSGTKVYSDVRKRDWDAFFYNPRDKPNYLVVQVAGARLTIRAIKTDGTPIDAFYIDKKKDVDSDCRATVPNAPPK
jgi:hypothetical protein